MLVLGDVEGVGSSKLDVAAVAVVDTPWGCVGGSIVVAIGAQLLVCDERDVGGVTPEVCVVETKEVPRVGSADFGTSR